MATRARRQNNKPSSIRPVSNDPKISLMLFAHPGVGKTTFIGSGPDRSLILRPPMESADPIRRQNPRMEEWIIRGWTDMFEALEWLREEKGGGYEWVWLDSISLMQDTGLDDIWADTIARKASRAEYGLDKSEYGINMFRLGQWVRHCVGSGTFHLGITAHPALLSNPDKDEDQEDVPDEILMPWIQGKQMATKVCGYMNIVAYLRIQNVKSKEGKRVRRRVLYTDANGIYYAKNSLAPIPNGRIISPTVAKLEKYVLAGGSAATTEE